MNSQHRLLERAPERTYDKRGKIVPRTCPKIPLAVRARAPPIFFFRRGGSIAPRWAPNSSYVCRFANPTLTNTLGFLFFDRSQDHSVCACILTQIGPSPDSNEAFKETRRSVTPVKNNNEKEISFCVFEHQVWHEVRLFSLSLSLIIKAK